MGQIADSVIYQMDASWITDIPASGYRVIVLGCSGMPDDINTLTATDITNLGQHLAAGGGVVLFGDIYRQFYDSTLMASFQPYCPITMQLDTAAQGLCPQGSNRINTLTPVTPFANEILWYSTSLQGTTEING